MSEQGPYTWSERTVYKNFQHGSRLTIASLETASSAEHICAELNRAHAAGQASREQKWISVEERLPEPGKRVLTFIQRKTLKDEPGELEQHVGYKMTNGPSWVIGNYFSYDMGNVIAWRELDPNPLLPPPPQQTKP